MFYFSGNLIREDIHFAFFILKPIQQNKYL
jgi:hypothetical protein